jgi:hypothetical protein
MDVDQDYHTRINKAFTEADKRKYRDEDRCFECNRQRHMARECPSKKRQPFKFRQSYPNQQGHFQHQRSKSQHDRKPQYNFQQTKRFPPHQSHARAAFIEEMDDSNKGNVPPMNNDANDIPTIAARTARFSEEEREQWVKKM